VLDETLKDITKEYKHGCYPAEFERDAKSRDHLYRHARKALRWERIAQTMGYGRTIAFLGWVTGTFDCRATEGIFNSFITRLRDELKWFRETEFKYLDSNAREILLRLDTGWPSLFANGIDILALAHTLQGFPWDDFSCGLDAILLIGFLILPMVCGDTNYSIGESASDVLRQVVEEGRVLLETPWPNRDIKMMRRYRDAIRKRLSGKNIRVDGKTALGHLEQHIIPSSLLTFPISMMMSCSNCQCSAQSPASPLNQHLSFNIREGQYEFTTLQNLLDFIV